MPWQAINRWDGDKACWTAALNMNRRFSMDEYYPIADSFWGFDNYIIPKTIRARRGQGQLALRRRKRLPMKLPGTSTQSTGQSRELRKWRQLMSAAIRLTQAIPRRLHSQVQEQGRNHRAGFNYRQTR